MIKIFGYNLNIEFCVGTDILIVYTSVKDKCVF